MGSPNNVFRGPNSVADFFDPEKNPPVPLVEIPDRLNPHRKDAVRIYAKLLTHLPAQNVKSLPALKMLRGIPEVERQTIVEASSGSTVLSLGILARVLWGNEHVNAYVTNKKHPESLNMLRFFGITPHLYGGLAQQEPTDPTGIMCRLRRLAKKREDIVYPGQYDNENNWKAHEQWTGPQILRQLPEINLFCTTVGTGGCITGTSSYLKSQKPSVRTLGVFNVFGDPTPGPRHFENFNSCGFPWAQTVDTFVDVASVDSYRMSMRLSREGLIAGPSSGQALKGLLDYVGQLKETGELQQLADPATGEVSCVFTCSDLPYQYLPLYFQKLRPEEFPSIQNEILLQCDQLKHDERWILTPLAAEHLLRPKPTFFSTSYKNAAEVSEITLDGLVAESKQAFTPRRPTPKSSLFRSCFGSPFKLKSANSRTIVSHQPRCCAIHAPSPPSAPLVLDLRSKVAFRAKHVPGSLSVPLEGLTPDLADGDLFGDPEAVFNVWNSIQVHFSAKEMVELLKDAGRGRRAVVVVCYDGDASRLATATFRDRGIEAFSVQGGFAGLQRWL
ncbi:cysteine synthase [Parathielavia appendiculata]|uniref:Cysteine synthase n=1 Tax=Parathielavia appendiculata TaxID=2587402 RepID=A0AAN6U171_9PEZI|nr:cysteine synthase [Parathielavia appendiculata]